MKQDSQQLMNTIKLIQHCINKQFQSLKRVKMSSLTYRASFVTSQTDIRRIIKKLYEERNKAEHKILVDFIQPYFPSLPRNIIKLMTFYLTIKDHENNTFIDQKQPTSQDNILFNHLANSLVKFIIDEDLPENSFVIILQKDQDLNNNPEVEKSKVIQQVSRYKQKKIELNSNQVAIVLSYDHYLNCITLGGQTTIQDQIEFFHTSEYLCSMPKKKYYSLLRKAKILSYIFRQNVYFEGQDLTPYQSGSGVYLVRQGELAYYKNYPQSGKNIEVFRFGTGHLLGSMQIQENKKKRLFTVKSKSSRSVVYNFDEQLFNQTIKPYCQGLLDKKQKKLGKFLIEKTTQISNLAITKPQFFGLSSTTRNCSNSLQLNTTNKANTFRSLTYRQLPTLINKQKQSDKIQKQQLRKTSYFSLRNEGPLKTYPKTLQRARFTQSQFRDLQKLIQKNEKINKIKNIQRQHAVQEKRGEILFGLFKESWKFQNQRLKSKRY